MCGRNLTSDIRETRFDSEDSKGTRYNIEIQQSNDGADLRRARFHMGMIDIHSLKAGQDFKELPECYVIFITQEDVLKCEKTVYTIHKYIDGDLVPVDDGLHTISMAQRRMTEQKSGS